MNHNVSGTKSSKCLRSTVVSEIFIDQIFRNSTVPCWLYRFIFSCFLLLGGYAWNITSEISQLHFSLYFHTFRKVRSLSLLVQHFSAARLCSIYRQALHFYRKACKKKYYAVKIRSSNCPDNIGSNVLTIFTLKSCNAS